MERLFVSDNSLARSKGLHKWYLVTFDGPRNPQQMAQKFVELASVEYVQFNTKVYRNYVSEGSSYHYTPRGFGDFNVPFNDPLLSDQWHYINYCDLSVAETSRMGADVNVKDAWRLCAGDPDIIVAICDEGVKYNHPDLIDNMWVNEDEIPGNNIDDDNNGYIDDIHGWNFLSSEEFPKEIDWTDKGDKGHGTHVAGTVAAVNNNGIGVGGVILDFTVAGSGVTILSRVILNSVQSAQDHNRSAHGHEHSYLRSCCSSIEAELQVGDHQIAGFATVSDHDSAVLQVGDVIIHVGSGSHIAGHALEQLAICIVALDGVCGGVSHSAHANMDMVCIGQCECHALAGSQVDLIVGTVADIVGNTEILAITVD